MRRQVFEERRRKKELERGKEKGKRGGKRYHN